MSDALAERVARLAATAKARPQTMIVDRRPLDFLGSQIRREWWTVTKPGGEVVDVFFCPPQAIGRVLEWYPGAGAVPGAR